MAEEVRYKKYSFGWWKNEVIRAEKKLKEKLWDPGEKVLDRYDDVRATGEEDAHKFNIFWANVGILRASLYANPPKPMVTRQYGDFDDDLARVSSEILERLLTLDLQTELSDAHQALKYAIDDRLIPGLGQIWHRYTVKTEPNLIPAIVDPNTGQTLAPEVESEKITDEQVHTDYVFWKDFIYPPVRVWEDLPWVARRVYMREEEIEARFSKRTAKKIIDFESNKTDGNDSEKDFAYGLTEIIEIWCKTTRTVYWLAMNSIEELLDQKKDFLGLPGFFPCPRPLLGTLTSRSMIPKNDYSMVQDQYRALDELNARIVLLEQALRVAGVYDKGSPDVAKLLDKANQENKLYPVENWASLAEKGGIAGVVDWLPIEIIAKVLEILREQRADKVQQIYELTGLSDIMRGATSPRETAKAQQIKAQYSSARLQYLQGEVALFVQQSLRIKAEIICNHFQAQTMLERSNIMTTPDAQLAEQAVQLLKDKGLAKYRIEVLADSMAIPDYNAERDSRVEFLTMLGQFLGQCVQLIQQFPPAAPHLIKLVQWVAAGFRGSRQVEGILDQAFAALTANMPGPVEEGGGTNEQDVQAEQVKEQGEKDKIEAEKVKGQAAVAREQARGQADQVSEQAKGKTEMIKGLMGMMQPQPPAQGGGQGARK